MIESVIKRKKTRKIWVGDVPVGGNSPISVQSMTNTDTDDVVSTVKQIHQLQDAGADIVRVSVPTLEAAESFKKIILSNSKNKLCFPKIQGNPVFLVVF